QAAFVLRDELRKAASAPEGRFRSRGSTSARPLGRSAWPPLRRDARAFHASVLDNVPQPMRGDVREALRSATANPPILRAEHAGTGPCQRCEWAHAQAFLARH